MTDKSHTPKRPVRLWRLVSGLVALAITLDLAVLAIRWVQLPHLRHGPVPMSRFMKAYLRRRARRGGPPLRWRPVALTDMAPALRRAVVLGEDATFYRNDGFDAKAILWAARYDWRAGRIVYGASTITQQTAKNLFLDPARTFFRKGNEALLTIALTHFLSKDRILEIYLNDAQFGRGLYGADAAAHYYFHEDAADLTVRQAAELAATLPDPIGANPATRSRYFRNRTAKILRLLRAGAAPGRPAFAENGAYPL
ncbi:monofunctional biosynthetic peptidoglycan transglycosylase [Acidiferrobacter sp.]|uniref:monofunctional biosynthetic peptidoglycan transglycosylase n=1 Tax=Acidiferrobacter sp. TaxID=1872107 RepID=UPI002604E82B|nr:monofunctional biosynthetic peptidoglycan transglycosylase [Acidiferrobacter sp.]